MEFLYLACRLDPFRNNLEFQAARECDRRGNNRLGFARRLNSSHEGSIYFDPIHRETLQINKRRVPRAKVINTESMAERAYVAEGFLRAIDLLQHCRLCDLEIKLLCTIPLNRM
jgi:hypothetical protein